MREFSNFLDLTGQGRELKGFYHGIRPYVDMSGRIMSEEESGFKVGISVWEEDVVRHKYDQEKHSLNVWYSPFDGPRSGGEVFTEFPTPKDIQEINVYDANEHPFAKFIRLNVVWGFKQCLQQFKEKRSSKSN